jgi:L-ascorbate metabolism protein UlaG (beta-lactamase superfamily)
VRNAGAATLAVGALGGALGGAAVVSAGPAFGARPTGDRRALVESSPQWNGERFANPLPREQAAMFTILGRWIRGADHTVPTEPLPVVDPTAAALASAPASGLRVTWLGHSTLLLAVGGQRILIDPVWSERASPFSWAGPSRFHAPPLALADLPTLDAVVISHDHYDHLDHRTIQALSERVPRFIVPLGVGAHLEEWGVDPARIIELDWWQETALGELTITATPARHFSGRTVTRRDEDATLWAGWVFAGATHRVYYSGDTSLFPELVEIGERLGPFDLTLIESGAYDAMWADVHLGPEQAVLAHQLVRGGLLVPVHWGTFDLALHAWTEPVERLLAAADSAGVRVVVPRPGESVEPATAPALERWWPEVPWRRADQAPVWSSGVDALRRAP